MVRRQPIDPRGPRGIVAAVADRTGPQDRAALLVPDVRLGQVEAEPPDVRVVEALCDLIADPDPQ